MKRLALFFLSLTISLGWAIAQDRTVTGNVISSEDNEPVMGANVVVEGNTAIGVTTDLDGNFTLKVPANAKRLVISFVGLKTQTVDIAKVMKIVLHPDSEVLGDVVVLGYGSGQKISTVSGSVARVTSEKIAERPVANIMDALQGQVAGMQVATSSGDPSKVADVKIHGSGSLGASSTPLYIVDGMQTSLSVVASMNPNDFESVTVLKDAASTSIFGARAANGVVVITTKKGKGGEKDGRILFSAQYGVSRIVSERPLRDMMNVQELLAYQAKHGLVKGRKTVKEIKEYLADPNNGFAIYDKTFENGFDWLNYYFKTAPTSQADISFSGGSDRTQYYISLGQFSQEGISHENSRYSKYSGRINVDTRVKDWLKIGLNSSASYGTRQTVGSFNRGGQVSSNRGTAGVLFALPYYSPLDENGKPLRGFYKTHRGSRHLTREYIQEFNAAVHRETRANVGGYAQLTPIEGLTLKSQIGMDATHHRGTAHLYPGLVEITDDGLGFKTESFSSSYLATFTNTAEYKFNVKEDHSFTALLGQEWVNYNYNMIYAEANGMEHKNFWLLSDGRSENYLAAPDQDISSYAFLSFFGRLNYGYKDFLFLDASLRNDQSSRFGPNKRSAIFYSVGAMFDLYRVALQDVKWLDALRLRASWGTTGNSAINLYSYQPLLGAARYTNALGLQVSQFGNPNLSWETQGNFNFGVNAEMFDGKLGAEVDYYFRNTSDMLMSVPQGYSTGFGSRYENVGSLYNTGVDVTLNYNILRTKDWNVYASTTFNYNINRITKLFGGLSEYVIPNTGVYWGVGKAEVLYMAEYAGVNDKGQQMWVRPDGTKTTEWEPLLLEKPTKYKTTPPVNGGFSLGASWKGIALDADFAYVLGKWTLNNDRYFTEGNTEENGGLNRSRKLINEWTKPGDELNTDIPKYGETPQFDTRFVEDASFLRLKNLRLSYTLPSKWFADNGVISGAKVYVLGRNLLTVTKFTGFDPETALNTTSNVYPNTMQFVGGLQLQF